MITYEQINRGGSKLEITRSLFEAGLNREIPIPRSVWKYYGQSLESVLSEFGKMKKPVIARGSHLNDYHGFIDVVPTHRDISTVFQLQNAVKDIEDTLAGEDVKIHCADWGQPYTPEVHVLIQEQGSEIAGSMFRHPHTKELIIQYADITDRDTFNAERDPVSSARLFYSGSLWHRSWTNVSDDEIKQLIEMYKKLEASGVLDNEWSQQVEFGLKPLMFYQARPFRKFQDSQDDSGHDVLKEGMPHLYSRECFGITPKEGINVDFVAVASSFFESSDFRREVSLPQEYPYGLILTQKLRKSIPTRTQLFNMQVFCSPCEHINYLFHNNYRLMKKAEITLIDFFQKDNSQRRALRERYPEGYDEFRESKVFSNGSHAVVVPRKYL